MVVRCSACGALDSEWAGRCGACGADLTDALPAPRRRASRHPGVALGAGTVVLVVLVGVAVLAVGGAHHRREHAPSAAVAPITPAPATPSSRLGRLTGHPVVVVSAGPSGTLIAHDLAGGADQVLARDVAGWPENAVAVTASTEQVVFVSGGRVYVVGGRFVAVADSLVGVAGRGEVWATPSTDTGPATAQLLDAGAGWSVDATVQLDRGETPVAADPAHLVTVRGPTVVVRDAHTGRVITTTGPVGALYDVVGITANSVVFVPSGGCQADCPLDVVDMTTGATTKSFAAPAQTRGFIGGGAVSSAGEIAAFVAADYPPINAEVVLISPPGVEKVVTVPVSISDPVGSAAWDPSGGWLAFGGPTETYLLNTATMRADRLPFVAGYGMSILPRV